MGKKETIQNIEKYLEEHRNIYGAVMLNDRQVRLLFKKIKLYTQSEVEEMIKKGKMNKLIY